MKITLNITIALARWPSRSVLRKPRRKNPPMSIITPALCIPRSAPRQPGSARICGMERRTGDEKDSGASPSAENARKWRKHARHGWNAGNADRNHRSLRLHANSSFRSNGNNRLASLMRRSHANRCEKKFARLERSKPICKSIGHSSRASTVTCNSSSSVGR